MYGQEMPQSQNNLWHQEEVSGSRTKTHQHT